MAAVRRRLLIFFICVFFCHLFPLSFSLTENEALLKIKSSVLAPNSNNNVLSSWTPNSSPCRNEWEGIFCNGGLVSGIRLSDMNLSGTIDIDALTELKGIRSISLANNSFAGPIPEFNRLGALKALYISGNKFSDEIPTDFFSKMASLRKVWFNGNGFTGSIPESLTTLKNLVELHLENNQFSGKIPVFRQPTLTAIDLSNNQLEGEIPESMARFHGNAFSGNEKLCGKLMNKDCSNSEPQAEKVNGDGNKSKFKIIITASIFSLIVLCVLAMIVLSKTGRQEKFNVLGKQRAVEDDAVQVHVASDRQQPAGKKGGESGGGGGGGGSRRGGQKAVMGDLVVVNEERGVFGLPDLMKAAAEVLGNGQLGSAYKAVMVSGVAVVVKRVREMNRMGRDGFDAEMRRIGRLRHVNVLTPLAYHYRKEEKLVVSEYVPKGSLLYVLHGDRGISHGELNWPNRLKIIQGIARGLGYLLSQSPDSELPHGNLKSSNVLLDTNYEPLLSDYAFYPLINSTHASHALFAFKSPEAAGRLHQISPKCDVFCLGILLLELMTGKFPSQYLNNGKGGTDVVEWARSAVLERREVELIDPEIASSVASLDEMAELLRIGAACTESDPNRRLGMEEAIGRIQAVKV